MLNILLRAKNIVEHHFKALVEKATVAFGAQVCLAGAEKRAYVFTSSFSCFNKDKELVGLKAKSLLML